ncbi:MAG: PEP-CTERM sorting domain-containing protein [Pseudomonadota bacterium]
MKLKLMQQLSALALALGLAASAQAQQTFFGEDTGQGDTTPLASTPNADQARANFLAALATSFGTEDFEGFDDADVAPLVVDFTVGTATLTGGGGFVEEIAMGLTNNDGRYPTSGTKYWDTDRNFTITFSEPIRAFGFSGIDMGDFNGRLSFTYGSEIIDIPHTVNGVSGSVLFFGIIADDPFTTVSFANSDAGDVFGFDDFTVARLRDDIPPPPPPPTPRGTADIPVDNPFALGILILLLCTFAAYAIRRD